MLTHTGRDHSVLYYFVFGDNTVDIAHNVVELIRIDKKNSWPGTAGIILY